MDPNMQDMLSSYLKIKKLVEDEETDFVEEEEEEEEKLVEDEETDFVEEEEEEEEEDVERESSVDVRFVDESQLKKKKLSLGEEGSSSGRRSDAKTTTPAGTVVVAPPCCLVENCRADLTGCKKYHQRHRVCEVHAKAPVVLVDGLRQRFCQQCSRFHELSEFDQTKRSCRRRLAGHNERRRKSWLESQKDSSSGRLKENQCRHLNGQTEIGNQQPRF